MKKPAPRIVVEDTPSESDPDDDMSDVLKSKVQFSPDVEVRVYQQPRPIVAANTKKMSRINALSMQIDGIKSRLGKRSGEAGASSVLSLKKTTAMKPPKTLTSPASKQGRMRSDMLSPPVHSRLDIKHKKAISNIKSRISNVSLSSVAKDNVFNRLGRNK